MDEPQKPQVSSVYWIQLVTALNRIGWPDERIAAYTHESVEHVAATRERLGLSSRTRVAA